MRTYNNELAVTRGESFTLDFLIKNPDGSPYIVSSELTNPQWLITVANTRYTQTNRYVHNTWLAVDVLRFHSTTPVKIESFDSNTHPDFEYGDAATYDNSAVYTDGVLYKYWKYNEPVDAAKSGTWVEYEAPRLIVPYTSDVTREWTEQEYLYSIALVDSDQDAPFTAYNAVVPILAPTAINVTTNLASKELLL